MTSPFRKEFLEEIKNILMGEEKRLIQELSAISQGNPKNKNDYQATFPALGDKEDENAAEVASFSDNLTLERELEASLRDVRGGLDRLEKGIYGICKYCQKSIDERRLRARPMSSACVECKKLLTQEV